MVISIKICYMTKNREKDTALTLQLPDKAAPFRVSPARQNPSTKLLAHPNYTVSFPIA
jgi:hypothetical protein